MKVRTFRHGRAPASGSGMPSRGPLLGFGRKEKPYEYKSPYLAKANKKKDGPVLSGLLGTGSYRFRGGDGTMLFLFASLAVMGFAVLWSGSSGFAMSKPQPQGPGYFLIRQLEVLVPALFLFLLSAVIPLGTLRRLSGVFMLAAMVLLLIPIIPGIGETRNGASRWIRFGSNTIQPSEFWKPALVFYLSHILDKKRESMNESTASLLSPFAILVAGSAIIFLQSNFSTAAVVALAGLSVFWAAGAPPLFFIGIVSLVLPLGALSVLISDYRMMRVLSFIVPSLDPHGQGYQVQNSLKAVISGGWFGKGIGLGTRKIASIPAVQSDFIFAAFVEETGFVGVLLFFLLWGALLSRIFKGSFEQEGFRSFLSFGLGCLIAIQVLANVAVVSGFVPATGLPLPLFSAGGSSLFMIALCFGLLYNCTRPEGVDRG